MLDKITENERLMVLELGDNRIKPRTYKRFLSSVMAEGWGLIEVTQGEQFIMKFIKKCKRKRKRKNRYLNEGVKT
jgi:hypothetical protein